MEEEGPTKRVISKEMTFELKSACHQKPARREYEERMIQAEEYLAQKLASRNKFVMLGKVS